MSADAGKPSTTFKHVVKTMSHTVAQDGLKFVILLPLPPMCWDHRYELLHQVNMLGLLNVFLAAGTGKHPVPKV